MKVVISEDERFPFYGVDIKYGYHPINVRMTDKKYIWCTWVLKEFEKVQKYLEKRYAKTLKEE